MPVCRPHHAAVALALAVSACAPKPPPIPGLETGRLEVEVRLTAADRVEASAGEAWTARRTRLPAEIADLIDRSYDLAKLRGHIPLGSAYDPNALVGSGQGSMIQFARCSYERLSGVVVELTVPREATGDRPLRLACAAGGIQFRFLVHVDVDDAP